MMMRDAWDLSDILVQLDQLTAYTLAMAQFVCVTAWRKKTQYT